MGSNLVNLMKRNAASISALPESKLSHILPHLFSLKSPTLHDVDQCLTRMVGGSSPPFPFPSALDYYKWASSHDCLKDIRVPTLAVNAADDPIVGHVPLDVGGNGYVALVITPGGGHLGWFECFDQHGQVRRWITCPAIEWLRAIGEDLITSPVRYPLVEVIDGWTSEVGRPGLGYMLAGEVGEIVGVEGEGGLLAGL